MKQNEINDDFVPVLNSYNYAHAFNVYNEDGFYYYNLLKNIQFPDDLAPNTYQLVRPRPGELLPQISYRVYKQTELWWIIALINKINNPLEPLNVETPLKVMQSGYILNILNTIINE